MVAPATRPKREHEPAVRGRPSRTAIHSKLGNFPRKLARQLNCYCDRVLDTLNEPQREAATHGDGPLLIIAGAGSGKTTTLVHRVAQWIDAGVAPQRILLLTFTRRSAADMLGRARAVFYRPVSVCCLRADRPDGIYEADFAPHQRCPRLLAAAVRLATSASPRGGVPRRSLFGAPATLQEQT